MASVVGTLSHPPKDSRFNFQSGDIARLQVRAQMGDNGWFSLTSVFFFLSLPSSLQSKKESKS